MKGTTPKFGVSELCREKPYLVIAVCLLIAHLLLGLLYLAFGCRTIGYINLVSIVLYAAMTVFYDRITSIWHIRLIIGEILQFSLIAVLLYGDDACYSVNIVPLIPVLCCWDYESKYVHKENYGHIQMRWIMLVVAVVYIIEQLIDWLNLYVSYPILAQQTTIICFFNFITLFLGVLIGTIMWWNLTNYTAGLLADSLQKADYFANHDALTGLENRKSLNEYIKQLEQSNQEYAFMIADIDNFKRFNDTYGHDCGDAVLQRIGDTIRRHVRANDHIFRWGGEEIVIILPEIHRSLAEGRAAEICKAIAQETICYGGNKMSVTVTIGVAVSRGRTSAAVMKEADLLLFQGKEDGKTVPSGLMDAYGNEWISLLRSAARC